MDGYRNVFDALKRDGHDEYFRPVVTAQFEPTDAAPGSSAKLEMLRRRVLDGVPLWHRRDRVHYEGLCGGVRPRYF